MLANIIIYQQFVKTESLTQQKTLKFMDARGLRYTSKADKLRYRAECTPIKDLLFKERTGKFLTPDEKKRVQAYATEQRKKNANKK